MRQLLIAVAFVVFASPAAAQVSGTLTPTDHKNSISTAPISDIMGFVNAEYQRKINETATFGISAGTFELDNDDFANAMVFGRYYPQGAALTGFFVGGRAGVHRVTEYSFDHVNRAGRSVRRARPAIGIDVGYDWLLGTQRRFYIGLGAGGVRLLGGKDSYNLDAYPTARLNVGFAF
jgi:hypothetical protein